MASVKQQLERAKSRLKNMNQAAADSVMAAVETVEVVGTAGALGFARGRFGDEDGNLDIAGAPPELLVGAVAHLGALVMAMNASTREAARHARAIGNGGFAAFGFLKASEIGADQKSKAAAEGRRRRLGRQAVAGSVGVGGINSPMVAHEAQVVG